MKKPLISLLIIVPFLLSLSIHPQAAPGFGSAGGWASLPAPGGSSNVVMQESVGAAFSVRPLGLGDLPSVLIDSAGDLSNALCADGEVLKKAAGAWSCLADATGGSPNWN